MIKIYWACIKFSKNFKKFTKSKRILDFNLFTGNRDSNEKRKELEGDIGMEKKREKLR